MEINEVVKRGSRISVLSVGGGYVEPAKVIEVLGELILVKDLDGSYRAVRGQYNALMMRQEYIGVTAPAPDKDTALIRIAAINPAKS